jgi:hypothetical protein
MLAYLARDYLPSIGFLRTRRTTRPSAAPPCPSAAGPCKTNAARTPSALPSPIASHPAIHTCPPRPFLCVNRGWRHRSLRYHSREEVLHLIHIFFIVF